jgi:purine-binding chemotaxis protein CheW
VIDEIEQRRIFKERAKRLARQEEPIAITSEDDIYVMAFVVAGQNFACDTEAVSEVSLCKELTRIPCTPRTIAGVVNLRSEIIPALDTRFLFQLPAGWPENSKLIILHDNEVRLGILADDVLGVEKVSVSKLRPPLANMTQDQIRHIRGLTDNALIVLDAFSLMNDPRIVVNETVD